MSAGDIESLVLADVIGALDAKERQLLRESLAQLSPDARAQVARLYDLTLTVAAGAEPLSPSPRVREALLARLAAPSNYTLAADEGRWIDAGLPGVRLKILALDRTRDVVTLLLRAEPGARYPAHRHSTPEECYVIRGSVRIEGRLLRAGDFHHADGYSHHGEISTEEGAEVLLIGSAHDYLPSPQ
jgi:anti-sigma factor ChrR (cupin superfamily)